MSFDKRWFLTEVVWSERAVKKDLGRYPACDLMLERDTPSKKYRAIDEKAFRETHPDSSRFDRYYLGDRYSGPPAAGPGVTLSHDSHSARAALCDPKSWKMHHPRRR